MPKVELKVAAARQGLIEAPTFCPFKTNEEVGREAVFTARNADDGEYLPAFRPILKDVVHASICQLCKMCQFYTELTDNLLTEADYDKVAQILTADQQFLTTVINQVKFLQKQDRTPLAVLVNYDMLRGVVEKVFDLPIFDKKLSAFVNAKAPLCVVAGLPVYFSDKLTKCVAQVVGEVDWSN